MNIYGIKDLVEEEFTTLIMAKNDKDCIRKSVIAFGNVVPFRDMEVYQIAELKKETGMILAVELRKIPWELYTLPENEEEAVKPLGKDGKVNE